MGQEQVIREILERMEDKGRALENLSFDGEYKVSVNDLDIELTYNGKGTLIFYEGGCKRVEFIEELAQEVVYLLTEYEWEAGQVVRKLCATRVLVDSPYGDFNLLDDDTYSLEYEHSYTMLELKTLGWERA